MCTEPLRLAYLGARGGHHPRLRHRRLRHRRRGNLTKRAQSPVKVDMRGGSLTIAWAPGEPIRMRGSATHVFRASSTWRRFG